MRLPAVMIAVVLSASSAAVADAPRPLRELQYDVSYSAHTSNETKSSGFNSGYGGGGGPASVPSGEGTESHFLDGTDRGTLTVDVIAATADGGLVVDVAFKGEKTVQPPIRVAVLSDGRLSADPAHPLCPEAIRVLPLLARGFVANRDVSPGSSWTTESAAPARGGLTYHVATVDGDRATIGIEGSFTNAGGQESDRGSTVYATNLLSPVSLDLTTVTHRQMTIDTSQTTTAHLTASLLSDSFAKR